MNLSFIKRGQARNVYNFTSRKPRFWSLGVDFPTLKGHIACVGQCGKYQYWWLMCLTDSYGSNYPMPTTCVRIVVYNSNIRPQHPL